MCVAGPCRNRATSASNGTTHLPCPRQCQCHRASRRKKPWFWKVKLLFFLEYRSAPDHVFTTAMFGRTHANRHWWLVGDTMIPVGNLLISRSAKRNTVCFFHGFPPVTAVLYVNRSTCFHFAIKKSVRQTNSTPMTRAYFVKLSLQNNWAY
jgi:hypothetical protein